MRDKLNSDPKLSLSAAGAAIAGTFMGGASEAAGTTTAEVSLLEKSLHRPLMLQNSSLWSRVLVLGEGRAHT